MTPATGLAASGSCSGMIEASSVNTTTATTMPSTQPMRKPTLVPFAFGESSMRIAAMIGIGLIAIPSARGRMSPMTEPMCRPAFCGARPRQSPVAASAASAARLVSNVAVRGEQPEIVEPGEGVGPHAAEPELDVARRQPCDERFEALGARDVDVGHRFHVDHEMVNGCPVRRPSPHVLTASVKTVPFAKNSGAASRTTMTPGAVTEPFGASASSESVGSSLACEHVDRRIRGALGEVDEREHERDEDARDRADEQRDQEADGADRELEAVDAARGR